MRTVRNDWMLLACVAGLWSACPGSTLAADISRYRLLKSQCYLQATNNFVAPSIQPFQFWAQVWLATNHSVSLANVTLPNFSSRFLSPYGTPVLLAFLQKLPAQALMDTQFPTGSYKFALTTQHDGQTNLTLTLPDGSYPVTPQISNLDALQSLDPTVPVEVSWNGFTGGGAGDFIELQILNTGGAVFESGPYPGAPGALDGMATSIIIPSNTLAAGHSYVGRLSFMRVVSTNSAYAPGFAAYAQQTDFYLSTVGATPPRLLFVVPAPDASGVPGNARVSFTFNKPMLSSFSLLVIGITNSITETLTPDPNTVQFSSSSPWPPNTLETWYLNSIGAPAMFGDLDGNPVMPETFATRFTAGPNQLSATPAAPELEILDAGPGSTVQMQVTGGETYRDYQLEASGDLMNWDVIADVVATNSSFIVVDPAPPPTQRSYRVLAVP